jgi:hypothetical protein
VALIKPFCSIFVSFNIPKLSVFSCLQLSDTHLSRTNQLIQKSFGHARTAPMVRPQLPNRFLCYSILIYNPTISPGHRTLRSRAILDLVLLNHDQGLSFEVVGIRPSFLVSVSSGTRHSIAHTILTAPHSQSKSRATPMRSFRSSWYLFTRANAS